MRVRFRLSGFALSGTLALATFLWGCGPRRSEEATSLIPRLGPDTSSRPVRVDSAGPDPVAADLAPLPDPVESGDAVGRIAFIRRGDLWVKDDRVLGVRRLTGTGGCTHPKWSPSGDWLTYRARNGAEIRVIRADGSEERFVMEGRDNPAYGWSPTEDLLALGRENGLLLRIDPVSGSSDTLVSPRDLPAVEVSSVEDIEWSPDGARIAFTTTDEPALRTVSADGGDHRVVYRFEYREEDGSRVPGPAILAGWTGDSRRVLFWQADYTAVAVLLDGVPLYAVPAGGGARKMVVDEMLLHRDFISVMPGGSILAVTQGCSRLVSENKRIVLWNGRTGQVSDLVKGDGVSFSPAWSPDGQRLAYVAQPEVRFSELAKDCANATAGRRVWVTNRAGTSTRRLADDQAYRDERPGWSKDGSCILLVRIRADDRASLWQARPDGSDLRCVVARLSPTPCPYYGHSSWEEAFDWWSSPEAAPDSRARLAGRGEKVEASL